MHAAVRVMLPKEATSLLNVMLPAAQKYQGVIPDHVWHEPYMSQSELEREIAAGVEFVGADLDGKLVGVMGAQRVRDVLLIRHAYVLPEHQGSGIGRTLLRHLLDSVSCPVLVGTWAKASWAIGFYESNGFRLLPPAEAADRLRQYWSISDEQAAESVVLERVKAD